MKIREKKRKIPKIWYLIILAGFIYIIIGIISIFAVPAEPKITHLPAWFRRILDGLFIVIFGLLVIKYPEKHPWKGWFDNSWVLSYGFVSLIIHYGGMLPPVYLYEHFPFFNKIMHVNASIAILFLSTYGCERKIPQSFDIGITFLIGIIWEIAEYLTTPSNINYWTVFDVGYGWNDTKGDLIANIIGIMLSYAFCYFKNKSFPQ